jgi:hypothetical protein
MDVLPSYLQQVIAEILYFKRSSTWFLSNPGLIFDFLFGTAFLASDLNRCFFIPPCDSRCNRLLKMPNCTAKRILLVIMQPTLQFLLFKQELTIKSFERLLSSCSSRFHEGKLTLVLVEAPSMIGDDSLPEHQQRGAISISIPSIESVVGN